ncbi:MAG TPA: hypothetical protein VK148_15880 [Xanthobacteraceae bacterium]|jgi:hypothetical protein|nr:hypothetical protein [Xanthobacteraceae bacterium]
MRTFGGFSARAACMASAFALVGCTGTGGGMSNWGFGGGDQPPEAAPVQSLPGPEIPATVRPSEVIGRWGYASFHKPEDRQRTEVNARSGCAQLPYNIDQGPSGGVMMYLPDQKERVELRLKGGPGGRNFVGPAGEPGGSPRDQEIVSFDGRVMTLRAVDQEVAGRYGTGIYVRCAPSAGTVAQKKR